VGFNLLSVASRYEGSASPPPPGLKTFEEIFTLDGTRNVKYQFRLLSPYSSIRNACFKNNKKDLEGNSLE